MLPQQILENRYRILRALSSGGFSETYLAEDLHLPSGRSCVIKKLKPIAREPSVSHSLQGRFAREAKILEDLGNSHPQIPSLYAYFESDGQFYLVQEWIEGVTLSEKLLQVGTFSESAVIQILRNILLVLEYVHSKRIIHRDIKPDNIILRSRDDLPVLIDFGAVKEIVGTDNTPSGDHFSSTIIGTPGFMPSEQVIGRPVLASDIYSLGLTALVLLTGKAPKDWETDPVTGAISWRSSVPTVSLRFADIIDKAIQSHPRDRYQNAREMLDAIEGINIYYATTVLSGKPEPISPGSIRTLPPTEPETRASLSDWQKAAIAGSAIGLFLTSGWVFTQSKSSNINYLNERVEAYYFVADDAYADRRVAAFEVERLKKSGYPGAGMFWIQDYPNLSEKALFQLYPAKFLDRDSCAKFVQSYRAIKPESYCVFGSKNPAAKPDRF